MTLLLEGIITAQYGPGWGGGMMGGGCGMGYGMGWFGPIIMIIFWAALILGIVALIRWLFVSTRHPGHGPAQREDAALELLRKRYARGEIDREEFEQKRKDLAE